MNRLIDDIASYPDVFAFARPTLQAEIAQLEAVLEVQLPPSFAEILERCGQGIFFDGESLLGVHEIDEGCGDLATVNQELRERQHLDPGLVVFHLGTNGLSAFDTRTEAPEYEVVALDEDSLTPGEAYPDFDAWYQALRAEYADIFGLDETPEDS